MFRCRQIKMIYPFFFIAILSRKALNGSQQNAIHSQQGHMQGCLEEGGSGARMFESFVYLKGREHCNV